MLPTPDHDFDVINDGYEDMDLEELVFPDKKAKVTKRENEVKETERLDLDKYINSDFELVAETSLQAFAVPNGMKKGQGKAK